MAEKKRIELGKQQEIKFDDKIRDVVNFLNDHYNIRIPIQDPEKIQIVPKDEERWKYPPKNPLNDISLHLMAAGHTISDNVLWKIISSPNYIEPCDPVKDYFDSIRGQFKGESHIDLLCQYLTPRCFEDNTPEYYRERTDKLIRKWLVACVACWLDGVPNEVALGFIHSRGGIGKTYLTKFLIPGPLQEYYTKSEKDDRIFNISEAFTRYMIINFDEMVGINKGTINSFKKVVTDDYILTKSSHDKIATQKKRLGCAVFTENRNQEQGGFILDCYGDTRRFGCIELESIDQQYSTVVDIDQLWSEALNLYEETVFSFQFTMDDFDEFVKYNQRYAYETDAMKYVMQCLSVPQSESEGEKLNATNILQRLMAERKIKREDMSNTKVNVRSMGAALASLGFQYVSYRDKDSQMPLKGWHVKFNE